MQQTNHAYFLHVRICSRTRVSSNGCANLSYPCGSPIRTLDSQPHAHSQKTITHTRVNAAIPKRTRHSICSQLGSNQHLGHWLSLPQGFVSMETRLPHAMVALLRDCKLVMSFRDAQLICGHFRVRGARAELHCQNVQARIITNRTVSRGSWSSQYSVPDKAS